MTKNIKHSQTSNQNIGYSVSQSEI